MKLQTKMTLLFSISISVIFSIAILFVSAWIWESNQDLTTRLNTQIIESKAAEAGSWLTQRISELRIISKTNVVMTMDPELKDFVNRLNDDLSPAYGNEYGTFAVGGTDGLGYVTDEQTIDISSRDYFREAMATSEEYVLSTPVLSKTDKSPIMLICYPVLNNENEKVGFVNGAVSLKRLTEITDGIQFYNGTSLILDSHGNIYTNAEDKLDGVTLDEVISHVPDGTVYTETYTLSDKSGAQMLFYVPVPDTNNWYLCTIVERSEIFGDTWLLIYSILAIWAILIIVVFILSYFISRTVTKPVKELSLAMEGVQSGNLDIHLTPAGKDEVSLLTGHFNQMVMDIRSLIDDKSKEQQEKYLLRLQVFQSQIKPHFLYNTLDTLHWKALEHDAEELAELVSNLSSFFRTSLSEGREFVPLKEEIEHVRSYLAIQQFRYSDILTYSINLPYSLEALIVTKFMIQPLVENAIYHGIKPKLSPGCINIKIHDGGTILAITVEDDGIGMSEIQLEKVIAQMCAGNPEKSYGLYNIHQRIQLIYGEKYGLTITSRENIGTKARICIPKIEEPDGNE